MAGDGHAAILYQVEAMAGDASRASALAGQHPADAGAVLSIRQTLLVHADNDDRQDGDGHNTLLVQHPVTAVQVNRQRRQGDFSDFTEAKKAGNGPNKISN